MSVGEEEPNCTLKASVSEANGCLSSALCPFHIPAESELHAFIQRHISQFLLQITSYFHVISSFIYTQA